MKTLAFFNNKGGVGKTTLVYHLAWIYADMGIDVVLFDLDPQANLTSVILSAESLEDIWTTEPPKSIWGAILPLVEGTGDIQEPDIITIDDHLSIVPGDLSLSFFEDDLSKEWPSCMGGNIRSFRVIASFYLLMYKACRKTRAELVLIDVGPNLGAITRSAIISSDYFVIPMAPDLFSLLGLRSLGPRMMKWRGDWRNRLIEYDKELKGKIQDPLPSGGIKPIGYILMQHAIRGGQLTQAYERWADKIPDYYAKFISQQGDQNEHIDGSDPNCLATIKHYRSLMPMAHEARKPIFKLLPADGAIGAHQSAAQAAKDDFKALGLEIGRRIGL